MVFISDIKARQVFDSRGYPTVEAEVILSDGARGRFITPSGASVGKKEALELRDGDKNQFAGKGVHKAIKNIETVIKRSLLNASFRDIETLDERLIELDGTPNKSHLGANAVLAVSGAYFHAMATHHKKPLYASLAAKESFLLPLPLVNVINGGVHANNGLDIQEFMIVPIGASSFSNAMRMVAETFYMLKQILAKSGFSTAVGDEGGFAPHITKNETALELLAEAVNKAGYFVGKDIVFALDVAANELYDNDTKTYRINGNNMDRDGLVLWYENLIKKHSISSIEDPFSEDDTAGFTMLTKRLGDRIQIVGDDLFVTNERYIREGIENHYANAVLIKINQIGTISEAIKATRLAQSAGFNAVMSHRSGDTEDTTIADLAVLTNAGQIKTGSLSRSERVAKYNRLLRIEEELAGSAKFNNSFHGGR